MKKLLLGIGLLAASCNSSITKENEYSSLADSAMITTPEDTALVAPSFYDKEIKNTMDTARAKKIVDSLKSRFISEKDDFQNITWYTNKRFGKYWPNRKTIYTQVRNDGYYNVISNYHSDDWIFHTSIEVMVGDEKFQTETQETYSENNRQDNNGGEIWENVRYSVDNRNILRAIAADINKPVKIRFHGRQFYNDATMNAADKKAIKESIMFAQALEAINNK